LSDLEQPGIAKEESGAAAQEATGRALRLLRELAAFTGHGQAPPSDLEPLVDAVRAGRFTDAAGLTP